MDIPYHSGTLLDGFLGVIFHLPRDDRPTLGTVRSCVLILCPHVHCSRRRIPLGIGLVSMTFLILRPHRTQKKPVGARSFTTNHPRRSSTVTVAKSWLLALPVGERSLDRLCCPAFRPRCSVDTLRLVILIASLLWFQTGERLYQPYRPRTQPFLRAKHRHYGGDKASKPEPRRPYHIQVQPVGRPSCLGVFFVAYNGDRGTPSGIAARRNPCASITSHSSAHTTTWPEPVPAQGHEADPLGTVPYAHETGSDIPASGGNRILFGGNVKLQISFFTYFHAESGAVFDGEVFGERHERGKLLLGVVFMHVGEFTDQGEVGAFQPAQDFAAGMVVTTVDIVDGLPKDVTPQPVLVAEFIRLLQKTR